MIDWKSRLLESRWRVSMKGKGQVLKAEKAPEVCPWCEGRTTGASRDENGLWTWNCFDGCNP